MLMRSKCKEMKTLILVGCHWVYIDPYLRKVFAP